MCGIVGAVAKRSITNILLEGLKRLEYRGYDSAGIAILDAEQLIQRQRTQGKVSELEKFLQQKPLTGATGIAHTRWATHGAPSEANAHPHLSGEDIALVHNGIIENHEALQTQLTKLGYAFTSETDSELIAHLIHYHRAQGKTFIEAVQATVKALTGAFALGIIDNKAPDRLIAVRQGCPLLIGLGDNENFIASDHLALLPVAKQFIYLEEGDIAELTHDTLTIFDAQGKKVERKIHEPDLHYAAASKGPYRHYMLKEIYDQPDAIAATLSGRVTKDHILPQAFGTTAPELFERVQRVQIIACGTSYHAALIAKYWLEAYAKVTCRVEIASEYRYRKTVVEPDTLFITVSQSGETADTLAALRLAKSLNYLSTLAICNVPESSLVRESDHVLMTRAGVEIGVASTKAFTTQLTALLMFTLALGRTRGLTDEEEQRCLKHLLQLPELCQRVLTLNEKIETLAQAFADKHHALFLGRGTQYPVALEGALKLKEISYIHAEAYPAGELKHGPLALVDKDMPVIAVAPNDQLLEKLKANLQEVKARGGALYVFADETIALKPSDNVQVLTLPAVDEIIAPLLYTLPLQLLAYHVAILKGTDVDQPRNLAKSVTVE